MSEIKATAALHQALVTLGLTVHWPNIAFTPPESAIWVKPHIMMNVATPVSNFAEGLDITTGIIQFDINGPTGKGLSAHNTVVTSIRNLFKVGATFIYDGTEVTIFSSGKTDGFESDKYWKEIVTCYFRFHSFRN